MVIEFGDWDWNDLKIFLAVARTGTQAYAAEMLGQSQPTVGRRIRALERSLGISLFYRDARGMELTDEGLTVLHNVEKMENEALSIRRHFSVQNELAGELRVAAAGWLGSHLLAPSLAQFSADHAQVQIHLFSEGNACHLARRELDVVYQVKEFGAPDIIQRQMMRISYGVYGLQSYLDSAGPIAANSGGHRLVALTGEVADTRHEEWLRTHLGKANIAMRTDSHEVLVQWCRNGFGLALLPHTVGNSYRELRLLDIDAPPVGQTVWAGYHSVMKLAPRLRALIEATQVD